MLYLEIFDFSMKRLGIINKYSMIQYTRDFCDIGSFELSLPITKENVELIKKERILWIEDEIAGIIQYIYKSKEEKKITVKGKLLSVILEWRYLYPCFRKYDYPQNIINDMVRDNCLSGSPPYYSRQISQLKICEEELENLSKIQYQKTGGQLSDAIIELALSQNLGFYIFFNPREEKQLTFKVIQGKDRTENNVSGNKKVVFSHSLNNVKNGEYEYNDESYKNVNIVVGEAINNDEEESETSDRIYTVIEKESHVSGLRRKELYTDARDLQSEYTEEGKDEEGNDITIDKVMPITDYIDTLRQRGNEKLAECVIEESYKAELVTNNCMFVFGRDYFLGDKVTVYDEEIGVKIDAVVTSVIVTIDSSGYNYEPVFGYDTPTIFKKIKRIV